MKIKVCVPIDDMGEPNDDGLTTDHRYPVEVHRMYTNVIVLTGELHDVAVWLMSHYDGDLEDRLYPLTYANTDV